MKLAIMQPYFIPYIGYFQLINAVDQFIIYDDIQYTKKGWVNRNRVLVNHKDAYITLPLKKDSDYADIRDRCLAESWGLERDKILNRLMANYKKAPYFEETYPPIEGILLFDKVNLFEYLLHSLKVILGHLNIHTPIIISSDVNVDKTLKSQEKVIAICRKMNASNYINPIGGTCLYNKNNFNQQNIELHFLKTQKIQYQQFENIFIPSLSIIDVLMFNSVDRVKSMINEKYELV
ncbi:hypothetical protein A9Q81_18790 [Gammaproteobacteria bacterium 42_54_T18]|nr:hypothetical protein A9Q81_18790 [Gammaproteobacteria bacterium 42_54_T18]